MVSLLFFLVTRALSADFTPEQRAKLLADLGCAQLIEAPAPPRAPLGLPRVTVNPQPGSQFFDAREVQRRVGDGEFLIGWSDADPLDFIYRVRVHFLDEKSADAREVESFRRQTTVSALIRLRPLHRPTARHVVNGNGDFAINIDEQDFVSALREHEFPVSRFEDVTVYVWHANGNPPLASEIASVRAAAFLKLRGRVSSVKMKVIGMSWGHLVGYDVDIPLGGK